MANIPTKAKKALREPMETFKKYHPEAQVIGVTLSEGTEGGAYWLITVDWLPCAPGWHNATSWWVNKEPDCDGNYFAKGFI